MIGLGTTRAALLTGTTLDEFGDEVDAFTVLDGYGDFAISLIERTRNVQDPDSGIWRAVAMMEARVHSNLPAKVGDRIRDNRTGAIYTIDDETVTPRGISGLASRTLRLKKTSA